KNPVPKIEESKIEEEIGVPGVKEQILQVISQNPEKEKNEDKYYVDHGMPLMFAKVCADIVLENPDIEGTLLYLWFLTSGKVQVETSETTTLVFELFRTAVKLSEDKAAEIIAVKSLLKRVKDIIAERASEEKLLATLNELDVSGEQSAHFAEVIEKYDNSANAYGKNNTTVVVPPKWILIDKIICHGQKYLHSTKSKTHILGPAQAQNKLLSQPDGKGEKNEKPESRDEEALRRNALEELEYVEKAFDTDYGILMSATTRIQNLGMSYEDFDNTISLPPFLGIDVTLYQKALKVLFKYDKKRAKQSYDSRKEKMEHLYKEYGDYLPEWTMKFPQEPSVKPICEKMIMRPTKQPVMKKRITLEEITEVFFAKLGKLRLTYEQKKKLIGILRGYNKAVQTAQAIDPDIDVPSKIKIMETLIGLQGKELEIIANYINEPGLIIVPSQMNCVDVVEAMNLKANMHYPKQKRTELSVLPGTHETQHWWLIKGNNLGVSIVEMAKHGTQPLEGDFERKEKEIQQHGLRKIEAIEYLMAAQQKLMDGITGEMLECSDDIVVFLIEFLFSDSYDPNNFVALARPIIDGHYKCLEAYFSESEGLMVKEREGSYKDRNYCIRAAFTLIPSTF
ncbi:hypothetical protein KJ835_00630, partial [Patescibacteria group bacterium]|nr:hypothetical protein [Patescibacteria group bacterium]